MDWLRKLFEKLLNKGPTELISPLPSTGLQEETPEANIAPEDAFLFQGQDYQTTPDAQEFRQPPDDIGEILRERFPDEATQAAVVAQTESDYNPDAVGGPNPGGSIDTGLMQINSDTFQDFFDRKKHLLEEYGITDYSQMKNPILNAAMAKIIKDEQGGGAWYGPKDKGYDITSKDILSDYSQNR